MSRGATPLRRGLPSSSPSVSAQADKRFRRPDARPGRRRWKKVAWRAGVVGMLRLQYPRRTGTSTDGDLALATPESLAPAMA
jgi:hypothetical protein